MKKGWNDLKWKLTTPCCISMIIMFIYSIIENNMILWSSAFWYGLILIFVINVMENYTFLDGYKKGYAKSEEKHIWKIGKQYNNIEDIKRINHIDFISPINDRTKIIMEDGQEIIITGIEAGALLSGNFTLQEILDIRLNNKYMIDKEINGDNRNTE